MNPRPLVTILALVPALAFAAAPRTRPPFTVEHAVTLSTISNPVWSPDGARLAFVVSGVDTAENTNNEDIWLLDARSGRTSRLTRHPKNDISPTFSPGGDTLAFVANRATGEEPKTGIWMMSLHGGEPWSYGSFDESVSEVAWSPDGRSLAFVKLDTLPKLVREQRKKKLDAVVEDQRLQFPHLWVVDLASGARRRLTTGEQYIWYVRWSPDSKRLAFLTSPTGKPDDENQTDIGVVQATGGAQRKLGAIGSAFTWSPDSRWIAWASGGNRALYIQKGDLWVARGTGDAAPVNLTASYDESADTPAWNLASDTLYFHAARGASTVLATVPRAGGAVRLGVDRRGEADTPVVSSTGRAAWVQSGAEAPPELWLADRAWGPGRSVTSFHSAIAALALGATRTVRWTSSDGVQVEGVLVRPAGAPANAPLKTLVQLHGGPYGSRFGLGFQPTAQLLAAHGYQVFMPNFRSSSGYGTAFMMRTRSDWGFQDWRDVAAGVDSLVKWRLADGAKLGIFGHSYGGYLSAWAITQTPRFDAAIVSAGAVDLAAHYGQSDIQQYRAFDFEGTPWDVPEHWARSSPMTHIRNVRTPTLIMSGEQDARVPYPQGQQLYRALLARKVPVEFVHYPREGHTFREPRHKADRYLRQLAWWDRWIR